MSEIITEKYSSSVESKLCKVEDLGHEMKRLTASLRASISIGAIWSNAFDHGTVRFSGIQRQGVVKGVLGTRLCFTEAWFINEKTQRWLTADELMQFKPEAFIHPDYVVKGNFEHRRDRDD